VRVAVVISRINLVNNFFYDKLTAIPTIKSYMDDLKGAGH
jgi:hypothetical protein